MPEQMTIFDMLYPDKINPVRELIDDPHMVFVGDYLVEELTEYYNKWCCGENETIDFVKIGEVDGQNLYNVVKKKQK